MSELLRKFPLLNLLLAGLLIIIFFFTVAKPYADAKSREVDLKNTEFINELNGKTDILIKNDSTIMEQLKEIK